MSAQKINTVSPWAPFRVSSYRYQWPSDLLTSWAFEMENIILGWYVLVHTDSVLLLAVFGVTPLAAVTALALPYAGILGKVFAELIDEAPRAAAGALHEAGARPAQVFLFALLPGALPDMTAYSLYRFECSLRSAAVLGFFGFPTLGYHLAASFENLYYGEVWTYLYTLLGLVVLVDAWSGAVRRRLQE